MRGFWSAVFVSGLLVGAASASAADTPPPVPTNEWPDPNFFIQDTGLPIPAMNDALTGPIAPIAVSGYSTGAREVTVRVASTADLVVGQYVAFAAPCDPALRATILQVQSIVPGASFKATLEYPSRAPTASAACSATLVQRGDTTKGKVGGGDITSNVHRFADGKVFPDYWISSRPAHTRLLEGGAHVLVVRKVTDGQEWIYWNASTPSVMAGVRRAVGAAVVVASGAGASARAYINSGSVSQGDSVATGPARTWVTAYEVVPRSATIFQEGVVLTGPVGSTFVIGELESAPYPSVLPDHAFSAPLGQTVMALASISPYIGVTFKLPKDGFDANLGQMSSLYISGGVSALIGNLEGESDTVRSVLSVSSPSSPSLFGPMVHQVLDSTGHGGDPEYYGFASGNWPVRNNHLRMYGTPGSTWSYVSWDIQGFLLLAGP